MRSSILNFIAAIALAGGTLVCAAETQPTQPPTDGDNRTVVQQLTDQLIAAKLEPMPDGAQRQTQPADDTIRLHARVRPATTIQPQAAAEKPATQPAQEFLVEIDVKDADARRVYDVGQLQIDVEALKSTDRQVADEARLSLLTIANDQVKTDGAYLGVGVDAPDETLRAQLSLAPGAGLVVNFVDENGPAKAAVQSHDVLQKLDDQLLINGEQLVALVRMRKPGETVSLTLLRRAKPLTVQVELGQRKPAKAEEHSSSGNAAWQPALTNYTWFSSPANAQNYSHLYGTVSNPNTDVFSSQPNLQNLSRVYTELNNTINLADYLRPRPRIEERPITFNDGELLATFGKGEMLAVDLKDGKVIYHGPIGTESQWNAMPKLLRDKLSSWRSLVRPPETRPAASGKSEPGGN